MLQGKEKKVHAMFCSYLKNGQGEGSRLAAPGLREADDVLACHAKFGTVIKGKG